MRKFIRHPSDIPIEVQLEEVVSDPVEYLRDISLGGLSFHSRIPLQPNERIRIRIPLVRPRFETPGRVVWCRPSGNHYDVGVEFIDPNDLSKVRMVEQICHIEHYKKKRLEEEGRILTSEEAALEWIEKYAAQFPRFLD
jgi:hypothetical protein